MRKNLRNVMVVVCFFVVLVVGAQRPKKVVLDFDFVQLDENNEVIWIDGESRLLKAKYVPKMIVTSSQPEVIWIDGEGKRRLVRYDPQKGWKLVE